MTTRWIRASGGAAAAAMALALGCAEPPALGPTPPVGGTLAPPSTGPWPFAGTVYEHTASGLARPLAGLRLRVSQAASRDGYLIRFVTSDAEGRYDLSLLGEGSVKVEPAPETGYLAPCPAGTGWPSWSGGPTSFHMPDVHVVQQSALSTTGSPDTFRALFSGRGELFITGRILGPAPSHVPIAGAQVDLPWDPFAPLSTTVSDAVGRYLLCTWPPGSGGGQVLTVRAVKPGYSVGLSSVIDPVGPVDIELVPQ